MHPCVAEQRRTPCSEVGVSGSTTSRHFSESTVLWQSEGQARQTALHWGRPHPIIHFQSRADQVHDDRQIREESRHRELSRLESDNTRIVRHPDDH